MLFDDIGLSLRQPAAALQEGYLRGRKHLLKEVSQGLKILQSALHLFAQGIGGDGVKNKVRDKGIGIDDLVAIDDHLVIAI